MTTEHRLLFGLTDIKSVTFECQRKGCGVRLSVAPDKLRVENLVQCPACHAHWLSRSSTQAVVFAEPRSAFIGHLPAALMADNENDEDRAVRILLEFNAAT